MKKEVAIFSHSLKSLFHVPDARPAAACGLALYVENSSRPRLDQLRITVARRNGHRHVSSTVSFPDQVRTVRCKGLRAKGTSPLLR
jgi:hypothetical protein